MSHYAEMLRLIRQKTRVKMFIGTFVSTDGTTAMVDTSNGRIPVKPATHYRPEVNETVIVAFIGKVPYLLGPSILKPGKGTVSAVSGGLATVTTDIGTVSATYNSGQTLSAGQSVKLLWSDGAHIVGVIATAQPVVTPPDPPATSKPTRHVDTFTPIDAGSGNSGSWGGWWQSQVWASDSTVGAWFYGSKIADTLGGANVSRIEIWISAAQLFGANPNIGYHGYKTKPGSMPTINAATPIAVRDGSWVQLPTSFGQFLASNNGGIGTLHGGYNKFRSLAQDARSGALRITSTY